jgi:hypothetical protein
MIISAVVERFVHEQTTMLLCLSFQQVRGVMCEVEVARPTLAAQQESGVN